MNYQKYISSLPIDFFFLVVDPFLDISLPQLPNFHLIYKPNLKTKNSGYLLSLSSTKKFISQHTTPGNKVAIIPFKPSAKIEFVCKKNNWTCVAPPSSLNRLFEDKIKFYQICSDSNLPLIESLIGPFSPSLLKQAEVKFGFPLVIQTHFGWAGNSTFLIKSTKQALSLLSQKTLVKISPYLKGYSLLNNCCLTYKGLIQSPPALQYTGLKSLTKNPFTTVGRQWPSLTSTKINSQVKDITTKFSLLLKKNHYHGFFGLDFFVHRGKVLLLECNPRLTASFAFYTDLEISLGLDPLFFFHLLEFTSPNYPLSLKKQLRFTKKIIGSEITLKNEFSTTIKKYNSPVAFANKVNPIVINPKIIQKLNEDF